MPPEVPDSNRRLPAYGGASILDLIRWARSQVQLDGPASARSLLLGAPDSRCQRVVVALFDGLGDRYLNRCGAGSAMSDARVTGLTSVFPSTTSAAVTTMMTGLSPAEHGLNGWVCRGHAGTGLFEPLPMVYHGSGKPLRHPLRRHRIFPYRTLYQDLGCPAFVISPEWLVGTEFSNRHSRGAAIAAYRARGEIAEYLAYALERLGPRGLVYVYLPHFDATAHETGMDSPKLERQFAALDDCFAAMAQTCRQNDALLLATADHGLIDAPQEDMICLGQAPEVMAHLALPLWGERRAVFCKLRSGRVAEFMAALEARWPAAIDCMTADEVIDAGLLGPGKPHRDLATRIGDCLLLPRGQGSIVDAASPEAVHAFRAVHGGLSCDEMEVPLLVDGAL